MALRDLEIRIDSSSAQDASRNLQDLSRQSDRLGDSSNRVRADVGGLGNALSSMKAMAIGAFGALSALATIGFAAGLVSDVIAQADAIGKMAEQAGIGTDALQKLQYAAKLTGVENESLGKSFEEINKEIHASISAADGQSEKFAQLGISMTNMAGEVKSADEIFRELSNKVSAAANDIDAAKIAAFALGDEVGTQLLPMLKAGGHGLESMGAEAEALGIVIGQDVVNASMAFNDSLEVIKSAFSGLVIQIAGPVITWLSNLITRFIDAQRAGKGFIDSLKFSLEQGDLVTNAAMNMQRAQQNKMHLEAVGATGKGVFGIASAYEQTIAELDKWTAEYTRLSKRAVDQFQADQKRAGEALTDLVDVSKLGAESVSKVAKAVKDTSDPLGEFIKEIQNSGAALNRLKAQADPAFASIQKGAEAWSILTRAVELNQVSMDEAVEIYAKLFAEVEKAPEKVKELEEAADPVADAFVEAGKRIDATFAEAWKGSFESFRDFSGQMKSALKSLLAELAHMAVTRPILVSMGAVAGGASGSAAAGSSAAGGSDVIGTISTLGTIASTVTSFFTGTAAAAGSAAAGASTLAAGAGAAFGGTAAAGTAAATASAGAGIMAGIGAAMPWIAGALAIASLLGAFDAKPSNKSAGGHASLIDGSAFGQWNMTGKKQASQETLDTRDALLASIGGFANAINALGGTNKGSVSIDVGERDGLQADFGEGVRSLGTDLQKGLDTILNTVLDRAEGISDTFIALIEGIEGGTNKLQMAQSLAVIQTLRSVNPVQNARDQIIAANRTLTDIYGTQTTEVQRMIAEYDGSLDATNALAAAYGSQIDMAFQLAAVLIDTQDQITSLFGNLREAIYQSLMGQEELYNHLDGRVDALVLAMSSMTDPAKIANAAAEIERLTSQMWGSLAEDQQKAMGGEFLTFLDGVTDLAQQRIDHALSEIDKNQLDIHDSVDPMLDAAAEQVKAATEAKKAAEQMAAAAAQMTAAAAQSSQAAAGMQSALSNIKIGVTVHNDSRQVG